VNPETTDERLAPFPIEHRIRIRTRFADIDLCRAMCDRVRPSVVAWFVPLVACVATSAFWLPACVPAFAILFFLGRRLTVWSALLDVRKHLIDQVGSDIAQVEAGIAVSRALPER
jgi:hypothetical protein